MWYNLFGAASNGEACCGVAIVMLSVVVQPDVKFVVVQPVVVAACSDEASHSAACCGVAYYRTACCGHHVMVQPIFV